MGKTLIFMFELLAASNVFALQNATLRIKKLDGQTVEKQVPFEKAGDAFRITVPVADIKRRMKAEGIDKAEICSVGWTFRGTTGVFRSSSPSSRSSAARQSSARQSPRGSRSATTSTAT